MLRSILCIVVGVLLVVSSSSGAAPPNIVFILADDLGPGDLGCYGQKWIATPNIDGLAQRGMRFTNAYAGSPVCAPSRCTLLTGLHSGHGQIRDNKEIEPEGQWPIKEGTTTVARLLKGAGYSTACVGKWGLGMVGSTGDPLKQGFDHFYGQNCQRAAHDHYPDHLWDDAKRVELDRKKYLPDMMASEAVRWIGEHKDGPFFLFFATTLPHVSLQAPEETIAKYRGKFGAETRFAGMGDYPPNDEPRATYAAMITRMDEHVGMIVGEIKRLGIEENTIVVFASDNGPSYPKVGADTEFFGSAMRRRGLKQDVYEGGLRMPLIVRWPGNVKAGATSDVVTAMWDWMPTMMEVAGARADGVELDGVSIVPALTGVGEMKQRECLYWEFAMKGGQRALRAGKWKGVQVGLQKEPNVAMELYDLEKDPGEKQDVAKGNPEVVETIRKLMKKQHVDSEIKEWNF